MSMFKWEVVDPAPGEAVAPMQRLAWGKTVGLGAQHVVAMFGATFVFPVVMGLDPNLAILFSGLCTILFLLIVQNKVPSYLGTSASFVASVAAIRALDDGNDSSYVTGAILVGGLVLAGHRRARPLRWRRADPQDPAAGRDRCGRHADRLQPRAGRRRHLLARGPVGRPPHRHVHGLRSGHAARLLVADRGVPGPDLRLPALVAVRRHLRSHHLGGRRASAARPSTTGSGTGRRSARPTGSACPAAPSPTACRSSTVRRSR